MPAPDVGIAHPGEMGAAIGALLTGAGTRTGWASDGRTDATRARADAAGLEDRTTLAALCDAPVFISVCPPHAALDVARAAAPCFRGIYVDANAIAPATAREVAAVVTSSGATFVDGGIVGPPPRQAGTTRLFLSGDAAGRVVDLFARTALETVVVPDASAMKVAYAAWTKGTAALLLAVRAYARRAGVEDALLAEWARSQPGLEQRAEARAKGSAPKAWRWVGEMREIAAAFAAVGLPAGFHDGAAEIFDHYGAVASPVMSIDPKTFAMTVEAREHVDAPPETVYDLVADLTRMGDWSPECRGGDWVEGDGPTVGTRFTGHNRNGENQWSTPCEIVTADRGRELAWVVGASNFVITSWRYTFTPRGRGTDVVEQMELGKEYIGFRTFFEGKTPDEMEQLLGERRAKLHSDMQQTLAKLKQAAESS
jgi:3-hydroxyisobutyrate dehydrogenase-like beta-hydroxyacid dehydrogenase/uncharacterized protein YndB with AHSA1/START domain